MNNICYILEPQDLRTSPRNERLDLLNLYDNIYRSLEDLNIRFVANYGLVEPSMDHRSTLDENTLYFSPHSHFYKKNVWHIKKSYLKNYAYFDKKGYSGWAEAASNTSMWEESQELDQEVAESIFDGFYEEFVVKRVSKWDQGDDRYDGPEEFVFLPLQVVDDSVMQLSRVDPLQFYREVVLYCKGKNIPVVIKRHPKCTSYDIEKFVGEVSKLPGVKISNSNIHDLIKKSLFVVAINSGVAFESLLHKKRVFTAGCSDFHWVTTQISGVSGLNFGSDYELSQDEASRIVRFVAWFGSEYLVRTDSYLSVKSRVESIVKECGIVF